MSRTSGEVEAGRLRYELGRLRDRRTVRAALALSSVRRDGFGPAAATLAGRPPRWDVPGPSEVPPQPRYPHLRAAALSSDPVVSGVIPCSQVRPGELTAIERDRVDLVLVDDLAGWGAGELEDLLARAGRTGARVAAVGDDAIAAVGARAHLRVGRGGSAPADVELAPSIDPRRHNPMGRDPEVVAPPADVEGFLVALARAQLPIGVGAPALRALLGDLADDVLVTDPGAQRELASELSQDEGRRAALSVRLRRHVLTHHARAARTDVLVEALDLGPAPPRRLALLLATRRPELLPGVCEDLARQRRGDVELLVAVHGDAPPPPRLALEPTAMLQVAAGRTLGEVLNALLDRTSAASIAKIDDDDRYGPNHLVDLELAMAYSGAELVGKRRHGVHDVDAGTLRMPDGPAEERWEDHLPGATMLARGDVLRALRWRHVPNGVDTELVRAVHLAGGAAYSTHRFGFVRTRHGDHTYAAGRRSFAGAELAGGVEQLLDV